MNNIKQLAFTADLTTQHTLAEPATTEPQVCDSQVNETLPTVLYRNKQCTKTDIEDLIDKLVKRKPVEPDPDDCCGSGCEPCVFDTFDNNMIRYDEQMEEYEALLLEFSDSE